MQGLIDRFARFPHSLVRWMLLALIGLVATVHLVGWSDGTDFNRGSYDQMVRRRLFGPAPDPRIVIVDIDEASLAQMKDEFGRWPWPRETLAAAVEWLNHQGAQAVVFDILFADADTLNPASDAAFVQTLEASSNTWFPTLRLNPANDSLSQVTTEQLPGFATRRDPGASGQAGPTVAVVPPVFQSMIASGRMGYHNVYADPDGVIRYYRLWEDKDDWRLWSLPARMGRALGWPLPAERDRLIHYTHDKDAYTRVPFGQLWKLSQSREGLRADPRFKDAIVIIGATATGLFDVKVTPLDITHHGVFVLANVIDNVKNGHFLREMGLGARLAVTWIALLAMGLASVHLRADRLKWAVLAAPSLFLAISFASLHAGLDFFLDLTPSASQALLFFSAWTGYEGWRARYFANGASQRKLALQRHAQGLHEGVLTLRMDRQRFDKQQVYDALPAGIAAAQVQALGALDRAEHDQAMVVQARLWDASPQRLAAALGEMADALGAAVNARHLSPVRAASTEGEGQATDNQAPLGWSELAEPLARWKEEEHEQATDELPSRAT